MTRCILPLSLALALALAPPALRADVEPPLAPAPDSVPFLDEMRNLLRDLFAEISPRLRDLERSMEALEPDLERLFTRMRDLTLFHPPEVLPNGDILIRRRSPDPETPDPETPDPDTLAPDTLDPDTAPQPEPAPQPNPAPQPAPPPDPDAPTSTYPIEI
ncbi:MAG: hypothetical protein ACXIU7_02170 [Roseinatronobacter sp.]